MFSSRFITALSLLAVGVQSLTPAQWRSQSIYQVMTDRFARTDGSTSAPCNLANYCGGTWQGLINHLDYIQGMGFTAIWVSPVVENLPQNTQDGQSYHGYWAQNIYKTNPNFGTAANLVALSKAVHARGMYLMVGIVTNHMGYAGAQDSVDYSVFHPFNKPSQYHAPCMIDYNNITSIRQCWEGDNIVSLPDLRTEDADVLSEWEVWIAQLISNYTIDGLRIDSAQQVNHAFWKPFIAATGGMYAIGEVVQGNPVELCSYQNNINGLMNYASYFWIVQAFQSPYGNMGLLQNGIGWLKNSCQDVTLLGSFTENHDQPRFASYTSDYSLAKNSIGFGMLADGVPIIYQGQEQHLSGGSVPYNREAIWLTGYDKTARLYGYIKQLNSIRSWAIAKDKNYLTSNAQAVYSDSNAIVMRKGSAGKQIVSYYTNRGGSGSGSVSLSSANTLFTKNQCVVDTLTCKTYQTDSNGNLAFSIHQGLPMIFYPASALSGSGICPSSYSCSSSDASNSTSSTTAAGFTISTSIGLNGPTTVTLSPPTIAPTSTISSSATVTNGFTVSTSIPLTGPTIITLSPPPSVSHPSTSTTATTFASSTTSSCPLATAVAVTFQELVNTTYGDTIKIAGSIFELGQWNTSNAVPLNASQYTAAVPLWQVTISLAAGTAFQYKFINVAGDGGVGWEADPNHSYTVPVSCQTNVTVSSTWQPTS